VALRVRSFAPHGVNAALYQSARPAPVVVDVAVVPLGDPRLPWALASQLVMKLRDFTVIDVNDPAA
jgi:hypothetical protein